MNNTVRSWTRNASWRPLPQSMIIDIDIGTRTVKVTSSAYEHSSSATTTTTTLGMSTYGRRVQKESGVALQSFPRRTQAIVDARLKSPLADLRLAASAARMLCQLQPGAQVQIREMRSCHASRNNRAINSSGTKVSHSGVPTMLACLFLNFRKSSLSQPRSTFLRQYALNLQASRATLIDPRTPTIEPPCQPGIQALRPCSPSCSPIKTMRGGTRRLCTTKIWRHSPIQLYKSSCGASRPAR